MISIQQVQSNQQIDSIRINETNLDDKSDKLPLEDILENINMTSNNSKDRRSGVIGKVSSTSSTSTMGGALFGGHSNGSLGGMS
ncbi:unnamed protein product, partial [Trichobilharzia regenti]